MAIRFTDTQQKPKINKDFTIPDNWVGQIPASPVQISDGRTKEQRLRSEVARLSPTDRPNTPGAYTRSYIGRDNDEGVIGLEVEYRDTDEGTYKTGWIKYMCAEGHEAWSKKTIKQFKCAACPNTNAVEGSGRGAPLKHDLVGVRYGKLMVQRHIGGGEWLCVCDCGNEKAIPGGNLRTGRLVSCGKCPKEPKRALGVVMIAVTAEAKQTLDRVKQETGTSILDLASAAILTCYDV